MDINECATNNGGCGNATYWTCTNNIGAPPSCMDINECATNNGGCGNATYWTCTNNIGAPPSCMDINECAVNNGGCAQGASCKNNMGCFCPGGSISWDDPDHHGTGCSGTLPETQENESLTGIANTVITKTGMAVFSCSSTGVWTLEWLTLCYDRCIADGAYFGGSTVRERGGSLEVCSVLPDISLPMVWKPNGSVSGTWTGCMWGDYVYSVSSCGWYLDSPYECQSDGTWHMLPMTSVPDSMCDPSSLSG